MLSRRVAPGVRKAIGTLACQRRYDHDRWYGHALELDVCNYKYTGEPPQWVKQKERGPEEQKSAKDLLPKHMEFASTWEALLFDAERINTTLNRKEFGNEIKFRLEKQANTVARSQQLVKSGQYTDPKVEDTMIARIADEEHVLAEMKYVKCIRANEVAEDNRLDILPGGSPNSLREKTRWNINMELHPVDRTEIGNRLTAWLPEKYHIIYYDDFQTVAANDANSRKEMLAVVDNVEKEHREEAKANGWEADLAEVVKELREDVDPTAHITSAAIKECNNLDKLEEWSRLVHEYNGDSRLYEIYEKAASITKNPDHIKLLQTLRSLYNY